MTQPPSQSKKVSQTRALRSEYKTQKRDQRREKIINAAAAVFAEKGFHNSTLKNIADHLGVLPAALYHYIESKEAALIEVCRINNKIFNQTIKINISDDRPVPEILRDAVRDHMQNNRRELVYSFAFRPQGLPDESVREMGLMAQEYQCLWESLFDRGMKAGDLASNTDPHMSAIAILAMMNGSVEYYSGKTEAEINKIANHFTDIILGAF